MRQGQGSVSSSGFTLLEVIVATSLLVVIALGSAQLMVLAVRHTIAAREQLAMTLAASRKADELSATVGDGTATLSPPDALERSVPDFSDVTTEAGVMCVRRWLVAPIAGRTSLAIAVRVSTAAGSGMQIVTIAAGPAS